MTYTKKFTNTVQFSTPSGERGHYLTVLFGASSLPPWIMPLQKMLLLINKGIISNTSTYFGILWYSLDVLKIFQVRNKRNKIIFNLSIANQPS